MAKIQFVAITCTLLRVLIHQYKRCLQRASLWSRCGIHKTGPAERRQEGQYGELHLTLYPAAILHDSTFKSHKNARPQLTTKFGVVRWKAYTECLFPAVLQWFCSPSEIICARHFPGACSSRTCCVFIFFANMAYWQSEEVRERKSEKW